MQSATSPMSRSPGSTYVYAFVCYAAFACVITHPLIWHLTSTVPHDLGDPLLSTTILWWNAHTLPLTERWWNGFAFYPAPGMLAFSDHRLGESLLATPLQWLGASPITAYNLTLLATFPASALAAHWLGVVLTKRHDAAAIGGLAYGFCPYRIAHLPHLELLAAFGMPAALAALHRYTETRRQRWLWLFACALLLQGLCSSYYLVFFSVVLALWMLWFLRRQDSGVFAGVLLAATCASTALLPLARGFSRIHNHYGFARPFVEIVSLSADVTSYVTAHQMLRVWGWTARWAKPERELFPGATIVVLALAGAILAWRRRGGAADRLDRLSRWLLPIAAVCAAIAVCGWAYAPWRTDIAGIKLSSDAPFKPATLAVWVLIAWFGVSSRLRGAYIRRSPLAFYLIATLLLAVCSLGPKPTFAGHQFLYEPPYLWLMQFPVFDSIRVPARFGLLVVLTLATTAAIAFDRLPLESRARRRLAAALLVAVVADGWIGSLAVPSPPAAWPAVRANGFAAVLELPLGDLLGDMAAMFRAIDHRHPVVNGSSGFEPTHYFTLKTALEEHDPAVFDGFPTAGRILVAVANRDDRDRTWDQFLAAHPRVTRLEPERSWAFYAIDPPSVVPPACSGDRARIVSVTASEGAADLSALTDGNPHTWWTMQHPQRAGDSLVLDLGHPMHPCAVVVALGEFRISYPRKLIVETSADGDAWTVVADQRMAGLVMRAALEDPKQVAVPIPLSSSTARFVRLRVDQAHPKIAWVLTDVVVRTASTEE
jgi:hypothetical protein